MIGLWGRIRAEDRVMIQVGLGLSVRLWGRIRAEGVGLGLRVRLQDRISAQDTVRGYDSG